MSGDTYYKVWCCMKDTPCPKVSQHIGIAADFEAATNMAINHLMTSTYHKMDEDEAFDKAQKIASICICHGAADKSGEVRDQQKRHVEEG